jgi:lysophospholipase L1-like esterase
MEPEIGNERLALAEALKRGVDRFRAGPDVWEPTKKLYPGAFARDRVHPNDVGAEVMAQAWFEALRAHDGLPVPSWSREEMEKTVASIR